MNEYFLQLNASPKALNVRTKAENQLWEYIEQSNQKGEIRSEPEYLFGLEATYWVSVYSSSNPLLLFDWLAQLESYLPNEDRYFLLTRIASGLDCNKEPQALLFEEIEKERDWLKSLGVKQELPIERVEAPAPTTPAAPVQQAEPLFGVEALTNNQLTNLLHFILKNFGANLDRKSGEIPKAAKVLHLLTGKPFTQIANSDYYQRLLQAPEGKESKDKTSQLKDLKKLQELFEKYQLNEIAKDVEQAIRQVKEGSNSEK